MMFGLHSKEVMYISINIQKILFKRKKLYEFKSNHYIVMEIKSDFTLSIDIGIITQCLN